MAGVIFERAKSPEVTEDPAGGTLRLQAAAYGTDDGDEVDALCRQFLPAYYRGLALASYTKKNQGAGNWDVEATYAQTLPKISFETGGGTYKRTWSIRTRGKYGPPGQDPPDYKGAIGVSQHGVEGVEVETPSLTWTETYYLPRERVTGAYIRTLYYLGAHPVNSKTFRGCAPGEVKFLGVSGGQQGLSQVEMTYKFAGSPNMTGLAVHGIGQMRDKPTATAFDFGQPVWQDAQTGQATDTDGGPKNAFLGRAAKAAPAGDAQVLVGNIEKRGWDYLWVAYAPGTDPGANAMIQEPIGAYVEEVFEEGDLTQLGIGQ